MAATASHALSLTFCFSMLLHPGLIFDALSPLSPLQQDRAWVGMCWFRIGLVICCESYRLQMYTFPVAAIVPFSLPVARADVALNKFRF